MKRTCDIKLAYNGFTTKYSTLKQDILYASKYGFDSIEARDYKLQDYLIESSIDDLKKLLLKHNITICTINSVEIGQNSLHGEKYDCLVGKLEWMCRIADEIGIEYIVTAPLFNENNNTYEENKEYLILLYQKLSDYFSKYKVKLGGEIISLSGAIVPNLDCALQIIKAINRNNVGLCFDCFAFYGNDSSMESIKNIPLEKLYIVHINDARKGSIKDLIQEKDRRFPGEGEIPLKEILEELKRIGYCGTYSIELITPYIWEWSAGKAIKHAYKTSKNIVYKVYRG